MSLVFFNQIAPIACQECGQKAPLIRRTPIVGQGLLELRSFECECGWLFVRAMGAEVTDHEIQSLVEQGIGRVSAPVRSGT